MLKTFLSLSYKTDSERKTYFRILNQLNLIENIDKQQSFKARHHLNAKILHNNKNDAGCHTCNGMTIMNIFLSLSERICLMNVQPVPMSTIVMNNTEPFNLKPN